MQNWYKEGLLNTDWATADFNQRMAEAVSGDCAVMMDSPDTMWGYWKEDNNIDFVAALNQADLPQLQEDRFHRCRHNPVRERRGGLRFP